MLIAFGFLFKAFRQEMGLEKHIKIMANKAYAGLTFYIIMLK
jgi:hypothetical protein